MADLSSLLAVIENDPDDPQAREALLGAAQIAPPDVRASRFASARKVIAGRGRPDAVVMLLNVELAVSAEVDRQVDLLLEKGMILDGELLDVPSARAAFEQVLALRANDTMAKEALEELDLANQNWNKFADKYVKEASASTDRSLATGLYVSAAEAYVRFSPDTPESETYLRKALEVDAKNTKAAFHLARLLRRSERWTDLAKLLESRADVAPTVDEKVGALIALADLSRSELGTPERAEVAVKRVLVLDPSQPQALRAVTGALAEAQNWPALIQTYQAALKARREDDLGMLLQIAMVLWKHIGDLDQAEEYFRRVRKIDPAHPAALDFYRAYYPTKGENQKLLAMLRQVEKSARPRNDSGPHARPIGLEIAELAEAQNNPEKAIEAWKQHLRQEPGSTDARIALARLYRRTEKWNALLDLMKEEIERLPEGDIAGRVERLHQVVEIYRDKLRLDVMVINTYNAILKIDPDNKRAADELAAKFRALGRWNDLIAVLTKKSEAPDVPDADRVLILREIADLWSERFGNFANAVRPLERILELSVGDADSLAKLKEIYIKRRQWRALIDVLGREASLLAGEERRMKQGEMARLAAERLGDTRLAIEIYNTMLADGRAAGDPLDHPETLTALAALYEREKRYLALAEILDRQISTLLATEPPQKKEAITLLEKLGQVFSDRLGSAQVAAAQWQRVLELEPNHAKALRTLRELYATAGDFAGLENLYARLGQEEELVDALLGIADRLDAKAQRLPLVERAAQLAQQRAEAAKEAAAVPALERARQVWERVLAVEPTHVGAARALAPIYAKQEKWARLITMYEIELAAAPDKNARLSKIAQIRQLCEQKLASRTLAFTWTLRAFDLEPASGPLYTDVLRLASEPDQWREVAASFDRHLAGTVIDDATRLKLLRELAKIASRRLVDPERARAYHRQVLALAPDDHEAEQHLEELSIQVADWPELLGSYRRRAAREKDAEERASLLIEIASLQEERLVDLDGAAATYREALEVLPNQVRAMRALARIEEARGDWESLAQVLQMELQALGPQAPDGQARFDLLMRLGILHEQTLEDPAKALGFYRDALGVTLPGGAVRPQAIGALVRYLPIDGPGGKVVPADRISAARLVLPHLEASRNIGLQAVSLEVIRAGEETTASERLDIDRALMRLYHSELGDPAAAWLSGLRVLAADPTDGEVRGSLAVLAGQLGRDGEWAQQLAGTLASLRSTNAAPAHIRAVATELAHVAADRLSDRATAERAWNTVLEVEPDASDAFEALSQIYRGEQRWTDLRALLERRIEVTGDDQARMSSLLELSALEEDVLAQPARAMDAHRRVLELDPGYLASYQALDRLYAAGEQWKELEDLLGRQLDHMPAKGAVSPTEHTRLLYRRAELFAHRLDNPTRAVDLIEDVISRQRGHEDARELLEELMPKADVTLRVARMLEPLYEQDKLWKDLVAVLRAQRKLATGTEAVELLSRIATIEETELSGARTAFDAWVEVLGLDPTHERARVELARLAQQLQRWPEATAALETAAANAPEGDIVTRAALLGELAAYYDLQLGDAPRAIAAYRRWLDVDGTNPTTIRRSTTSLARLYNESRAWPELRAVMKKQAEWAEDPGERRALLARVAALEEEQLSNREAAIGTWRDLLTDQPTDAGALNALERLYQQSESWRELIDILHRKLDHASPPEARQLLARIAEIHEVMLEEPDEAIAAHLDILDRDANDATALRELARLYREAGRHADLLEVLERQAGLDPSARISLFVEIAQLLTGPLARPIEALDRWKAVLDEEPEHPQAIAAVEAALDDLDLRLTAAEILRPVYDGTTQYERLAQLLLRTVDWADDPSAKLHALSEVVRLREYQLDDKPGALAALILALQHAATEPELPQVVAEVERLAGELGRESDLIDAYREVAPNVLDSEIQRRLYLDVADLARAVRRDLQLAREYYQKVLDGQIDDRRALAALESIYRETNDNEKLTEVLLRQADAATADVDDRVGALVEAAGLYIELDRIDDSISTWEQVLAVAPERRDAVDALEQLYRSQGRWPDVVDLYERRLGFATSIEEAVGLRVQLGEIHERHLHDIEAAIDNYSAALSGDSRHVQALAAVERFLVDPELRAMAAEVLEPIYVAQQRWPELIRVHEAKLESASDPRERLRITRFVARLYEEQLEDFENASRWYARLFREAPSDPAIRDQLQRLAGMVDNWAFVAQTYQQYLDDEEGESLELRDVAIAVAAIYDRRLAQHDQAFIAYRRALSIQVDEARPNERELIRRLEEMLGRTQKWAELVTIYEDVIARSDDDLRREALIKRARLLEDGVADPARAVDGWREVVAATEGGGSPVVEHAYREAVGELERLYRQGSQWTELVDLFESRLSRSQNQNETADLRLRLAEVLEIEVADINAALDQLEHVIAEGRLWERAVGSLERLVIHEQHRERIADLLEPVYRDQDWWQKLVVILDAKLDFIRDPIDQVSVLHEIALIHEQRGGALDLALEALARAWRIDVADDESLMKLLSLAGKLEAWDDAVTTLEEGAAVAPNQDLAAGLWARAAEIHEAQRGDLQLAIRAWRKVEESRPDDVVALAALDRLLAVEGRVAELVLVVARRAELSEDAGVRLVLLHRVAALYDEVLDDKPAAIKAYRNVLEVDDTDLAALDALERLYGESGDGRELVTTLERKIELTPDLVTRQGLRHAAAAVYEQKLDDVYQAIAQLTAILDDDQGDPAALAELDRIYAKQKMWPELLDVVDRRALLAISAQDRADLAYRAAHLVEVELLDPEAAIPRYGAVLQVLPAHEAARAALEALLLRDDHVATASAILERVYRGDRDATGLVRVYERRLSLASDDSVARRADWAALAEVQETLAGKPVDAFKVWGRAIQSDPDDADLLGPLLRLAEGHPYLWAELAVTLEQLLQHSLPPDVEQAYAMRVGQIAEDKLSDLDRAASAYEKASHGPEPRPALAALERVLARSSRWPDLAFVLRRQADASEDDTQTAEYMYREADLKETTLQDTRGAVAAYREVLQLVPAHLQARAALERMLASAPDQRAEIVEILEPLFDQDGDAARLVAVLEARLDITQDPIDRASLLARISELYEQRLSDRGRALDAALRWLAIDPASGQALAETERLAEKLGQWPEVASRVHAIVHATDASRRETDVQVALLTFLGRMQRERLGQLEEAAASYRAALVLEPEAIGALDDLIKILRQRGDEIALADALRHRGRIVAEVPEKRAAYAEVAQISERAGDRDAAITAWREIADTDEADREALDELARLYRQSGQKTELIDVLMRAARMTSSPVDEKALRVEIAQLETDGQRAVSAWQAVLDLDADDLVALSALEGAYARAGDWMAVSDIQTRRLSLAKSTSDKVAIHAEMARMAEQKRSSVDDAIASWYAALEVDASHQPAYDQLDRLLTQAGRSHDLVELLEKRAELYATLGDSAGEIATLARAADVWESQLDNPDAAGEILEKILKREPGSVAALTRLSKIYERSGDWDKCKATLEQALRLSPTGRDAADLFFRLGEVARVGDSDPETAILHLQQALKHDGGHASTIAALEKLARDRRDHTLLADLLQRRVATLTVPLERVALLVELAELERKAGRTDAALAALAKAAQDAPTDVRVLAPLADLYFASNRLDEAAPIYDRLAEEAKAGRRMKDVARFRQRQGGILEARGDRPGALAAYEEALRVNPTDVSTMTGLGRLYLALEDWEKARKIYQSLVLQNIDVEAGVTKGEVYWALGKIHLQLGQPPKAKSMFQRGLEIEPQNQKLKDALSSLA
ncbi:MAG: repeat-containing protein [Myxococcales bacterium]|nr:repeat-containing protein [Myxococcales bacterium]